MLPVGVALRLSRAVSEAAERSGAEERRLREELRELQRLLPPRKPRAAEILGKDGVTASGTEDSSEISEQVCGGEELQELELLNKALAKALRIRQTHKVLETELIQPGAPEGSTTVTDGGRGTVRQSAVARCHDQRSPAIPHGSANAKADKVGARMASSSCPAGGLSGKRTTPRTVSSRKPAAGTLKAPYKTELVGRRRLVSSTAGRLARGSLRSGSRADGTAATQHPDHGVPCPAGQEAELNAADPTR
ncbi:uncharacterized protein LOC127573944 [Pristis pectinata]|uniref:uncharacterized protein LOC127573944 n=1 Tax=Pristis pectinata TaxID=685728 RepID=UPI00223DC902|nr:uncharacterized protein LOC127573944 [Pristis pectinata]